MLIRFLPLSLKKYFEMSKRQRQHELHLTLWRTPLYYIIVSFFLVAATIYVDVGLSLPEYSIDFFLANFQTTKLLISALIGGILTLSAFTFNSLLVVLTMFSGQFSPRMLQNFVKDKQTQHVLGIFNGSFVYVLVLFLFISSHPVEYFVAVPIATVTIAFINAVTFVYFINHATTWMQVHNITDGMRKVSEDIINGSLKKDIENFRVMEPGNLMEEYKINKYVARVKKSGYVQLVDFFQLVEQAKEDDVIVKMEARVGSFMLVENPIFSFWGPGAEYVNVDKYLSMIEVGHKETEIQDLKMAMTKLSEIAIKAMGNNDPKTATNTIHQLSDLLLTLDQNITFTPYLADNNGQVRMITGVEEFDFYLYQGLGTVRHYAQKNYPIITEIISSLARLSKSISSDKHEVLWHFAKNTIDHIYSEFIFDLDRDILLKKVYRLAVETGKENEYTEIKNHLLQSTEKQTDKPVC